MQSGREVVALPRFPSLDGLRAIAILPVVWHHATPGPLPGILGRGPLGVDLFFVISGFLITSLLLRERARASGRISLGRFWIRRSLRIFPLYYVVLGAFVVHALLVRTPGPARDHFLASVPFYATYTSNWFLHGEVSHPIVFAFAWSLAAEEQFYVLWPPILWLCRGLLAPALVMGGLVLLDQAAERSALSRLLDEGLALRVIRSFATPIGLGSLLALANEHPRLSRILRAGLGRKGSSVVALSVVLLAAAYPLPLLPVLATHLAMTALVGACVLRRDHAMGWVLDHPAVRHVGVVSYGMYLLNVPAMALARSALGEHASAGALFVTGTLLTIVAATATNRLLERPLVRIRERFRVLRSVEGDGDRARVADETRRIAGGPVDPEEADGAAA